MCHDTGSGRDTCATMSNKYRCCRTHDASWCELLKKANIRVKSKLIVKKLTPGSPAISNSRAIMNACLSRLKDYVWYNILPNPNGNVGVHSTPINQTGYVQESYTANRQT